VQIKNASAGDIWVLDAAGSAEAWALDDTDVRLMIQKQKLFDDEYNGRWFSKPEPQVCPHRPLVHLVLGSDEFAKRRVPPSLGWVNCKQCHEDVYVAPWPPDGECWGNCTAEECRCLRHCEGLARA
jgi:hypothetical protein